MKNKNKKEEVEKTSNHNIFLCKKCGSELITVYPIKIMDGKTLLQCGSGNCDYREYLRIENEESNIEENIQNETIGECFDIDCSGKLFIVEPQPKDPIDNKILYQCTKCKERIWK